MYIVAVDQLKGAVEGLAKKLAAALGITPYEARPRVNVPAGGPSVVASFADEASARDCATRLGDAGFVSLSVASGQLETDPQRLLVRQLQFTESDVQLITSDEQEILIPYASVQLLLRGAGIVSSVQTETSSKKQFAPGRALLSGGLVMSKSSKTVTESTRQERQPFCHLYTADLPPVVLRQAEIDYSILGAERQLSRAANFSWICAELRRRCVGAVWDERLQTKPGLAQLLGPAFDPEQSLDLAISLLVRSYQHRSADRENPKTCLN